MAINSGLTNPVFDTLMPLLRQPFFWVPLYVFFIAFVFMNFGKKGYWLLLFTLLTVSTSDSVSSRPVKNYFQRLRPCNNESVPVIERVPCGSGYSFTSSHAANHAALATFMILTLGQIFRRLWPFLVVWAALVCIAQIYVGVHYPGDILGGIILGGSIGFLWAKVFHRFYGHTLTLPA